MNEIMCSAIVSVGVITFDLGVSKRGRPVYRISWFRNGKWVYARYKTFEAAYTTWKLLNSMK